MFLQFIRVLCYFSRHVLQTFSHGDRCRAAKRAETWWVGARGAYGQACHFFLSFNATYMSRKFREMSRKPALPWGSKLSTLPCLTVLGFKTSALWAHVPTLTHVRARTPPPKGKFGWRRGATIQVYLTAISLSHINVLLDVFDVSDCQVVKSCHCVAEYV